MRAFPVGDLMFYSLDDGMWRFPAHYYFRNVEEAAWRPYLDLDAAGKILVGHNCGLLQTPQELIVIDTGYGDDTHGGCTGHLLEDFARTGFTPDQVTRVILTHAHGDHIKRNTVMQQGRRRPTFAQARYYLGRADWDLFSGPGHVPEFDTQLAPLADWEQLALVDGALQLTPEVQLLPTPGHTPGHTSVMITSQWQTALYLGDVCHLPVHFSHPDWTSTFDTDPAITPRTRAWLFDLALARQALLICPHAPSPGAGRLEKTSHGVRWQPLP